MSTSFIVFCYEFIGTFCLVGVINATKGDASAIGLTLFFLLLLCGPITGAHFNPAVTLGVWINKIRAESERFASLTIQAVIMVAGQLAGAIAGMYVFLQVLDHLNGAEVLNKDDFPHLKAHTQAWGQAEFIEMFSTLIFVSAVLLVKDERAGAFSATVGNTGVNFFGCAIIALTLTAMILFAGKHTGASINPAVSVSQTVLASQVLGEYGYSNDLWSVYLCGPVMGGTIAGVLSWVHASVLRDFGPKTP